MGKKLVVEVKNHKKIDKSVEQQIKMKWSEMNEIK